MKKFIDNLQKSDEATKKKWLVVLSILSMMVIIALWLVYLNLTVPKMPPVGESPKIEEQKAGFFETLKAGFNSVFNQIRDRTKNAFNYFKKKAETERDIIIEKKEQNFILEEPAMNTATSTEDQ